MQRSDASPGGSESAPESRNLLSREYAEFRPPEAQKEPITRTLSREITEHKRQLEGQSYLDRAVSFVSSPIHGRAASLERLETLQEKVLREGSTPEIEKEIRQAIADDRTALGTESEITTYGGGMVQTAGLFIGGKKGLALSAVTFAAGSAKPTDSAGTQVADLSFGAARGLATRGLFSAIGKAPLDVPTRALAMGGSFRFTDAVLKPDTYVDQKTGSLDLVGGAGKVLTSTFDPSYVATDLLIFGGGQLALSNGAVRRFVEKSPLHATMGSASAFGMASGSAEEFKRQLAAGEDLDFAKIAARGLARSGTDMVASIPGGLQAARTAALRRDALRLVPHEKPAAAAGDSHLLARAIKENGRPRQDMPGTNSRQFQIVGGDQAALLLFGRSKTAAAVLDVREVSSTGAVNGPVKKLLVQHNDQTTHIRPRLASTVDLIASCNPQTLCAGLRSKHLFPEGKGDVFFTKLGNRISFGSDRAALGTAGGAPVALGSRSVSDLLLLPETQNMLRTPRPVDKYAREMRHFKDPALKVLDAGADSIVIELADGRILKMTDRPYRKDGQPLWRPEWGFRTLETARGTTQQFDARLLTKPKQIEVNNEPLMYYIQERAQTPVSTRSLLKFHDRIEFDGKYVFWDGGVSSLGQAQLGYVRDARTGKPRVVLLDYDAVRKPQDIPADTPRSPGSDNHWMSRYRADRVDWR